MPDFDTTSWFPPPASVKLPLSDGQWILVRKELTWGETQDALARTYVQGADGALKVNPLTVTTAMLIAYLVDWSLCDEDGPVPIRGRSADEMLGEIRKLRADRVREMRDALDRHEAAVLAARAQEKKPRGASSGDGVTSALPSAAAGVSSGSVN